MRYLCAPLARDGIRTPEQKKYLFEFVFLFTRYKFSVLSFLRNLWRVIMKIERDVAMPLCGDGTRLRTKYPFNKMVPGDSVFIEGQTTTGKAYAAAKSMGVQRAWKFAGRTVDGGLRIWRIE